jgi:glycerol-3-phosphate dehydrogenase
MPQPLGRDLARLSRDTFDVLVLGGGIYGLTVAADAAQRGLSTALVERNDFGSGTSFNHLRTIHGGLRYLQSLDLARARESIRERRTLAWIAPWAVRPLPFVLPLFASLTKGRAALTAGFLLDRLVGHDRNEHVPDSHRLPAGQVMGRDEARRRYPELQALDITGAAVWHDYVTVEADRLTLAWAQSASDHGAALANYVEATALLASGGSATGASVRDRLNDEPFTIRARTIVNATGARLNGLLTPHTADVALPLLQAMNLVTGRPAPSAAIGGRGASGRNLFLVPWQGRAVFGTWESPRTCSPDDVSIAEADVAGFIAELNAAYPTFRLTPADVTLVHRGVVPARIASGRPPALEGHELVFEHTAEGLGGVISVAGTKYTTARAVAQRIVDRAVTLLGRSRIDSRSATTPLPHVDLAGDALMAHAAANEMVVTLADAVMRRTPLGAVGCPDAATLTHAASIVGAALGWSAARQASEIADLRRLY